MALKIRLRQQGCNNRTVYRLVVMDVRRPRDGKYVESVGWYNPYGNQLDQTICLDTDRVQYWLAKGAQLSDSAKALVHKVAPNVVREINSKAIAQRIKKAAKRKAARNHAQSAAAK